MRRILLSLFLALALSGCALPGTIGVESGIQNPFNYQRLNAVEQSYKVMLNFAVTYRDLYDRNPCRRGQHATLANICAERAIVVQMQTIVRRGQIARRALSRFVRDNPTLDATAAIVELERAIATFNQIASTTGAAQ